MKSTTTGAIRLPATLAARDVRALQSRVRAFAGTGALQSAPLEYHR